MKKRLPGRLTVLLLMLVPLGVSLACATLTGDTPADSPAEVVLGSGPLIFPEPKAGLADLSSYTATLSLSFDGTRDGQTQQWSKTYVMLTTKEPAARQLTITKTGDISDPEPVLMAELDGAAYERRGENACNATVSEPENSLAEQWEPAGFLVAVIGAEEAGSETANGVEANHYTFDERALGQLGLTKSTGEMWVAADGGYIARYLVTTKGDAGYFGEGIEGTLTWDYELTDVNQPVTFALPGDCPAGMVNAPQLPDASNILNMPSLLAYDTASSPAEIAAFYQEQIPGLGWTLTGDPTISDAMALLIFTQGNQNMTVVANARDTGTNVQILLERSQQ